MAARIKFIIELIKIDITKACPVLIIEKLSVFATSLIS
jgi:hypothetical protein